MKSKPKEILNVYVSMPLSVMEMFSNTIHESILSAIEVAGMELRKVIKVNNFSSVNSPENVTKEKILSSDVVIVDISHINSNVFWEVGLAQGLKKPILIMSRDIDEVPFYLRNIPIVLYQIDSPTEYFVSRISEFIVSTIKEHGQPAKPVKAERKCVFFSYSHVDSAYLDRILVHIRPIERNGLIEAWSDKKISAGKKWKDEIRIALNEAKVAILLISADFLASDFITTNELPPLLKSSEEKGVKIIPIIIKPSRFMREETLSKFHAINDPKSPVIKMSEAEREELYAKIAEIIETQIGTY
ncbi:MAG: toll/interleukin-1 receptor domain-containing protein [bacterium]|nr:toll/interleukin-1 receptor domain-containing protein [bacterium]